MNSAQQSPVSPCKKENWRNHQCNLVSYPTGDTSVSQSISSSSSFPFPPLHLLPLPLSIPPSSFPSSLPFLFLFHLPPPLPRLLPLSPVHPLLLLLLLPRSPSHSLPLFLLQYLIFPLSPLLPPPTRFVLACTKIVTMTMSLYSLQHRVQYDGMSSISGDTFRYMKALTVGIETISFANSCTALHR